MAFQSRRRAPDRRAVCGPTFATDRPQAPHRGRRAQKNTVMTSVARSARCAPRIRTFRGRRLRGILMIASSFVARTLVTSPESINHIGGYGFRACARGASRNDGCLILHSNKQSQEQNGRRRRKDRNRPTGAGNGWPRRIRLGADEPSLRSCSPGGAWRMLEETKKARRQCRQEFPRHRRQTDPQRSSALFAKGSMSMACSTVLSNNAAGPPRCRSG